MPQDFPGEIHESVSRGVAARLDGLKRALSEL